MPIDKPWMSFEESILKELPASTGVYEIGDETGDIIYIGCAGGATRLGLRGEIAAHFSERQASTALQGNPRSFRYEVNSMYMSRWVEQLILFKEEYGRLPAGNQSLEDALPHIGRFHWKPSTGQWQA